MLASIIYFIIYTLLGCSYFYLLYDIIKENNKWILWTGRELYKTKDILQGKNEDKINILGIRDDINTLLNNKNENDPIEGDLLDTYNNIFNKVGKGNVGIEDFIQLRQKFKKWYMNQTDVIDKDGYIGQMLESLGDFIENGKNGRKVTHEIEDDSNIKELINMVNNS
ncbi:Transmembrane domain-containing protein [Orpheovirus IHUMI-LCC2]|uniref:Transmembrane domain-containing protein n=1 Tax=Orpheovirus IHUMI-LCC2 TaxID=2023057 RepID=A0A2I2L5Z1_9VIRU|nr:Transmembrane domain-containing protein [Orpheovirus IHUMI-LCC2]SNW62953.1 Transmembrane domain-containing protein [Orpheovirus IHUMI-LCC2]